ncbi:hypothetical protein [Salinibacter ruber]|uniref:hypothetical protein n=1 Tax=Salinibacter ruber TaxID=146919 RepID=UPI002167B6E7|nr:hypothetical protein [Salinibacter ruber]MCS4195925.1 hypothetical protein [Salinibacter ruber]
MIRSCPSFLLLIVAACVVGSVQAQDLERRTLSHRNTEIRVRLGYDIERKTQQRKMMKGTVQSVVWTISTDCCERAVMAVDLGTAFSEEVRPDQIPDKQAQRMFDGAVERLSAQGGEKINDIRQEWEGYPSRVASILYDASRTATVVRAVMVGTVMWTFLWRLEEPISSDLQEWKDQYSTKMKGFLQTVEVIE